MSYILDALKRADAERERGSVPGLHTQPAVPADDEDTPGGLKPWMWMALGVSLALGGTLAWRLFTAGPAQEAPAPAPVVAQVPPPVAAPVPPPVPAPVPAPVPVPAAVPAPVMPAPVPAPAPRPAPPRVTAPPPAAPESRVYTHSQLPEDIRRELPTLAVGGSIYSENPASRFLIINGQVLHEGDRINADLSLEQIKLKAAVLRYKGYRYEITY